MLKRCLIAGLRTMNLLSDSGLINIRSLRFDPGSIHPYLSNSKLSLMQHSSESALQQERSRVFPVIMPLFGSWHFGTSCRLGW